MAQVLHPHVLLQALSLYIYLEAVFNFGGALCASQVAIAGTRQKLAHGENGDVLHMSVDSTRAVRAYFVLLETRRVVRPLAELGCHSVVLRSSIHGA